MKKPIGKRITSFLAAAALAATTIGGSFVKPLQVKAAGAVGGASFSLDEAQLDALRDKQKYTNDLSASINFINGDGSTSYEGVKDDTYYLLVHAVGKDSGTYTYADNESHDHYRVYEIVNDNGYFSTGSFNIVPATQVDLFTWSSPDAASLDGVIIKNKAGYAEGTEEGLINRFTGTEDWQKSTYEVTSTIEGVNGGLYKVDLTRLPEADGPGKNIALTATKCASTVKVNVYDAYDQPTAVENESTSRYFVLGYVVDKNAADKSYKSSNIKAWAIEEIDLENNSTADAGFIGFYPYVDGITDAQAMPVQPNADEEVRIRVFSTDGVELSSLKQCRELNDQVFDGIPDYRPSGDGMTWASFKHNPVVYKINVNFDEVPEFTADDHLYIRAEATHTSGQTYYTSPLVVSGDTSFEYVIQGQGKEANYWKDSNGNGGQRYHGSATESVAVNVVIGDSEKGFNDLKSLTKCVAIKDGETVKGYEVTYTHNDKHDDADTHVTTYEVDINFKKIDPSSSRVTYKDVLGNIAANFGITADRLEQVGHMQTNLAANYYQQAEFRPDLSDPDGGSIYVGKLVTFDDTDKSAGATKEVEKPYIHFENLNQVENHGKDYVAYLYTPYVKPPVDITEDGEKYVQRKYMSAEDISANVLTPAFEHISAMSDALAANEANITGYKFDDKYYIDGTSYPENSTLYIDGDSMLTNAGENVKGGTLPYLMISLRKGQNIVFNFKTSDTVSIGNYSIRILDDDGMWIGEAGVKTDDPDAAYGPVADNEKGQHYRSERNKWYDQYVMRNVIFNMNKATSVDVGSTAGLFVVKDPKSETRMNGTTTGWMATTGYFYKGSGEWHFPYSELEDISLIKTQVDLSKADIDGRNEVKGAHIDLYKKGANDEYVLYGSWNSDGTTKTFSLIDGDYYFVETAAAGSDSFVAEDGTTYKIVPNQIAFSIIGGVITVDGTQKALTQNAETGYVEYTEAVEASQGTNGKNAQFRFLDAETFVVKVSKVDIANGKEVEGATIQILDKDDNIVEEWTSTTTAHEITGLKTDEEYTLRETVAPDGYTIASDTTFSIDVHGNVTTTGTKAQDGVFSVLLVEDAKTKVKVSKRDIAGSEELAGATIQILDADSKIADEWVSKSGNIHEIEGLKTGVIYTLHEEVAPDGYTVATDTTFTIDEQGNVTTTGSITQDGILLINDTKTKISVSKVDITTEEEVSGAELKILDKDGTVVREWISAKDAEVIEGLKVNTEYTLRETVAPEGYTIAADTTFTIDKTGKVTSSGTVTEGGVLLVKDALTSVKISKVDVNGQQEVEGAVIQILDKEDNIVDEWTSTKKVHEIKGLKTGEEYTLRETVAPEGYTIASATKFTIDETGKVTSSGTVTEGGVLLVEDAKTVVKVSKVDIADGEELEGATIQILDKDGNVVEEWTSTKDVHEIEGLKTGEEYTLRETVAPEGYTIASATKFTIDETGKVTSSGTVTEGGVLLVEDAKTSVKVSKVDIANGVELEGATIQILDEDDNVVDEWTSTKDVHEIEGLKVNTEYTLRETVAPEGYTIATDTTFTIDETGKVTSTGTVTEDGALLVEDAKTSVKVSKVDIADGEELEGATIQILDKEDNVVDEWTSTKDVHEIEGLKVNTEYTLRETVAPEGYNVATDTTFTIDETGKVTSTGTVTEGGVLLVEDTAINDTTVTISKKSVTDETELEGAELTIFDDKNNEVAKWTSGKTAKEVTLKDGTYTLKETGGEFEFGGKTYKVTESYVTFTVKDGKVTSSTPKSANDGGKASADNDKKIFTISDAATADTTVTISKKSVTDETELEGAELTIFDDKNNEVAKWTSGKTAKEVTLKDGTYTLKETGGEFEFGGKTYKVTESYVTFTVKDGKVTSSTPKSANDGGKASADNDKKIFTISDAATADTTVTISKKSVTDETELEGAELTIFDDKNNEVAKWTSGKTAKEVTLKDGTYTLKETGGEFEFGGKTYKVTESYVTFTVKDGKVTSSTPKSANDGGKASADNDKKIFTISDASTADTVMTISKKEINGKDELEGAELTIFDENGNVVEKWTSGKTAKTVTLKDGTYTLKETGDEFTVGNKTYKVTDSTVEFTVKDGVVTSYKVTDGTIGKITVDGTNITVEDVYEEKVNKDTDVTISKKEINGKDELEGAELTIFDENGNVVEKWTSGKTAKTVTLKDGTYTLKETGDEFTVGNKTYKVTDSTVEFTVEDGVVTSYKVTDGTIGKITVDGTNITVEDVYEEKVNKDTDVTISKKEINGKDELEGAELTIFDENGNVVEKWTSGKTAKTVTLKDGTYTLKETGDEFTVGNKTYKVTDSTVEFTVEDGVVTSSKVTDGTIGKITVDGTNITVEDVYEEKVNKDTDVTISKKEINGKDELEGAELTIFDENGNVVEKWTSGKTAKTVTLKDGTYTLKETGDEFTVGNKTYKVTDSTVEFTVEDGVVTSSKVTDGTIGKITVDGTNITVEDVYEEKVNKDTDVTISKKEINGKDELEGAELTIFDENGDVVEKWTSGKTAKTVTLKDGTYTLKETGDEFTVGNKTYKVTDSTVEFTVEDGVVTSYKVTDGTIGKITVDGTNITVEDVYEEKVNKDTDVTISKKEINGKDELEGAELTIFDENGNVVEKWTSGKTAKTVTLKDGTYTLKETGDEFTVGNKTYKVTDSTVEFTVEDGVVTSYKVTDGTIGKITVDGTNITVEDVYEEKVNKDTDVTISKKEINGKDELEGAELTIFDENGNVVEKWTSGKTAKTVTLKDGTYTLKETGDEFTVGNKTYKVTDSTVEFTVEDGVVTSYKVTDGTIGKITVDGTNITVEDVYEEKKDDDDGKSDDEKKDDEDQKTDDEQKSDDEKKDDEDQKTDDEQKSDDEKKDDEDKKSDDEQKTDDEQNTEDEDKKKTDDQSDSESESKDDSNTGSGDANTNDSSTSDGNDNAGEENGSGSASTTGTDNAATGTSTALPAALALACGAVIIFRKKDED